MLAALALAAPASPSTTSKCVINARQSVSFYRAATWRRQDDRLARHTQSKFNERQTHSCAYARSLAKLWRSRALTERRIAERYKQPLAAIRHVFGPYASQAWAVAKCEGGSPVPSVNAKNGQYLGFFQMGDGERSRYGHSGTALGQATAAYRYFVATGRTWRPWECKP